MKQGRVAVLVLQMKKEGHKAKQLAPDHTPSRGGSGIENHFLRVTALLSETIKISNTAVKKNHR